MKRLQHFYINHKTAHRRKSNGVTLAELLVAMALVPILILAAISLYTGTNQVLSQCMERGQALTEMRVVTNLLKRAISNGTHTVAPEIEDCPAPAAAATCQELIVYLPDGTSTQTWQLDWSATPSILRMSKDGGDTWKQLSHIGTITPSTADPLFELDPANPDKVVINMKFGNGDHSIIKNISIPLRGSTGI